MKKILFVLMASLALFSCGSDDSGGSSKPTTISVTSNGTTVAKTFSYDNKNRIQTLTSDGSTVNFTYNTKNKVDKLTVGSDFYQFAYNSSNQLISVTDQDGDIMPVTSLGNNSYNVDGTVITLTSNGDLTAFNTATFAHSNAKGAFANVNAFDALTLYFADYTSYIYASKKRTTTIVSGSNYPVTYTEGEKGLPATASVDTAVITYAYTN